jgi:hypothetical protein
LSPLDALRPVGVFESSHIDMGAAALYRPWLPGARKTVLTAKCSGAVARGGTFHFTGISPGHRKAYDHSAFRHLRSSHPRRRAHGRRTQRLLRGAARTTRTRGAASQAYAVAPGPVAQSFSARLYPSNAEAARYGTVAGTVTNDMNGRGHFNAQIGGEQFQGEATRVAGSRGAGVANASGNRGGNLSCQYTMNSATLGSGQCVLNSGPAFTMHIGG